jgi:hypothetical protein
MSNPDDHSSDLDDFDPSLGADFDVDLVDDVAEEAPTRASYSQPAWQRLDERREAKWLREQLADWDDWDDGDDAGLH